MEKQLKCGVKRLKFQKLAYVFFFFGVSFFFIPPSPFFFHQKVNEKQIIICGRPKYERHLYSHLVQRTKQQMISTKQQKYLELKLLDK